MTSSPDRPRYFGLDCLRATAMLLGVVYHAMLFRGFVSAGPPGQIGPPGMSGASGWLQDWLHSFRMPLFFLISGFFSAMMFEKYGVGKYVRRRWTRIGVPLVVGLFTFVPAYILTRDAVSSRPAGSGGMPFGPPPGRGNGALNPPPGFGPGGQSPGGPNDIAFGPPPGGIGTPFGADGKVSERIFGSSDRYFHLNHLWFLWYLLVFVTLTPPVVWCLDRIVRVAILTRAADWLGRWFTGPILFPVALGLVGVPALVAAAGPFGRGLGLSLAIFRGFPDFLWQLDPDMGFYAIDFLAGWWLYRQRMALPTLAKLWLLNLIVGIAAFSTAMWLNPRFGPPGSAPATLSDSARMAGLALYSLGSAFTAVGLLGVFQRFFDRPTRTGRYLADTALWVYLAHQPLVIVGLAVVGPLGWPWWAQTAMVSVGAVAFGLLLFEAIVRPTPLIHLFGPAGRSSPDRDSSQNAVQCEANTHQDDPITPPADLNDLRVTSQAKIAHG